MRGLNDSKIIHFCRLELWNRVLKFRNCSVSKLTLSHQSKAFCYRSVTKSFVSWYIVSITTVQYQTMYKDELDTKKIGEIIRVARKAQKLSQEDLAAISKTGRRVISELENGKETVEIGKVLCILNNLGIALNLVQNWEE